MTGAQFITEVKVKLNRLDTSSYEDIRPEEVLFFGYEALKKLTLEYDMRRYAGLLGPGTIYNYLKELTKSHAEINLTEGAAALPVLFKLKDVAVFVTIGEETGWQPTREEDNKKTTRDEYNPFQKSYADMPKYRLINDGIKFEENGFTCSRFKYDYLEYPEVITESTNLDMTFISDLQDKTVTLILENLESRRLQSQPVISKS